MSALDKNLLLINPWIYDFTAFDLWSKPLGLLYIASFLRNSGFNIDFIDCLEEKVKTKKYGLGHFPRTPVEKPDTLNHIPRIYARYGIAEDQFINKLKNVTQPDAILVTSMMTYWYPGVKRCVQILRQVFPGKPIILGGVYATLMPEHAQESVKPDHVITGPGEHKVLDLLVDILGIKKADWQIPDNLDIYPTPAFDMYNQLDYLIIMTARGCPYNCSFCAQKQLTHSFVQRSPDKVVQEIAQNYNTYKLRDFAFYDDALFINRDRHIKPILSQLIEQKLPLRLHSPNGLFPRFIDRELADLMYQSGFKTIRLSFETANEHRHQDMSNKISNQGMITAIEHLRTAGFNTKDIEAYIIMGLPDQEVDEVISSIIFINNLGVKVRLASYSPIPGTVDFNRAVDKGLIPADIDPLLTNKSIFPLQSGRENYELYRNLRTFAEVLNLAADKHFAPFANEKIVPGLKKVLRMN